MPTPKRGPRLGGGPAQQTAILRNQATELFRHGRIRTTEAKAKQLRPYAERLITKAKVGDLHKRRQVLSELRDRDVVAYLFEEIGPRFADRNGGYTRIVKLPPRKGDNAQMALIELVEQGGVSGEEAIEESRGRRSRGLFGRRRRGGGDEAAGGVAGAVGTVADTVADVTESAADVAEDAVETAEDAVEAVTDAVQDAAETVEETAETVAEAAEDAAEGSEEADTDATDTDEDDEPKSE